MAPIVTESRLYLLVRRDLPRSYQAVQAAHAAVQYAQKRAQDWLALAIDCPTIALLSVANQCELEHWAECLGPVAEVFHEPDLNNQPTALAYFGKDRRGLSQLRLA